MGDIVWDSPGNNLVFDAMNRKDYGIVYTMWLLMQTNACLFWFDYKLALVKTIFFNVRRLLYVQQKAGEKHRPCASKSLTTSGNDEYAKTSIKCHYCDKQSKFIYCQVPRFLRGTYWIRKKSGSHNTCKKCGLSCWISILSLNQPQLALKFKLEASFIHLYSSDLLGNIV